MASIQCALLINTHKHGHYICDEKLTAMNTGRTKSTVCTGKTNLLSSHRDSQPPDPSIVPHSCMALQHTHLCPLHTCGTTKPGPLSLPQFHLVHIVSAAYHGFCVKQIHHQTINTLAAQLHTHISFSISPKHMHTSFSLSPKHTHTHAHTHTQMEYQCPFLQTISAIFSPHSKNQHAAHICDKHVSTQSS